MSEAQVIHDQIGIEDAKRTTFEDIPVEILLLVVQDGVLGPQDHCNLASLSKTLNHLCMPLYFKAYGMEYPHFRIDIHGGYMDETLMQGRGIMSGLCIAFDMRSIPSLVFSLRFRPDWRVPHLDDHLNRLCARIASATLFVRAIHSLDDVVITDDQEWMWDIGQGPLSDILLQKWVTVMGDFMNALLEKGCSSLQVLHGHRVVESYKFHQTQATKIKHGVQSLLRHALPDRSNTFEDSVDGLRGRGWEFRRPGKKGYSEKHTMRPSRAVLRTAGLLRFHIQASQFALPPGLSWTLGVLRCSPNLTSLSFANLHFHKPGEWVAVMTLIQEAVSPSLRELAFADFDYSTNLDDIMKFLFKLTNLEHLQLNVSCDRIIPSFVPSHALSAILPNLRSLSAPIKASNYLLCMRGWEHNRLIQQWRTFYKNRDFDSRWDYEPRATQHFNSLLSNVLRALRHRKRSVDEPLEIIMKLMPAYDSYGFMSNPHVLRVIKPLGGVNSIVVADNDFLYNLHDGDFRLGTFLSTIFTDAVQIETNLERVHPAIVEALSNGRVPPEIQSLLDWLKNFWPSIKRIVLGSWVLNNISEGPDNIQITTKVEVYSLW